MKRKLTFMIYIFLVLIISNNVLGQDIATEFKSPCKFGEEFYNYADFQKALSKIDTTLLTRAIELMKDLYPYVSKKKEAPKDLLPVLEKQYLFAANTIHYQLDISGLTKALCDFTLEKWPDYNFLESVDCLEPEIPILEKFGISKQEIERNAQMLESNKDEILAKLRSDIQNGKEVNYPRMLAECEMQSGWKSKGSWWCDALAANIGRCILTGGTVCAFSALIFGIGCLAT